MSLTKDDIQLIRGVVSEEIESRTRIIVSEEVESRTRAIVSEEVESRTRTIVREEIESAIQKRIDPRFESIEGSIEALNNDIKDIYEMISDLQKLSRQVAHFEKRDIEQRILASYKNIIAIANEAGVKLPQ